MNSQPNAKDLKKISEIVHSAIENKYANFSMKLVELIVTKVAQFAEHEMLENDALYLLKNIFVNPACLTITNVKLETEFSVVTQSEYSDVWNQVMALYLIRAVGEFYWFNEAPLEKLYALIFRVAKPEWRNSVNVPDFGGEPPTALNELHVELIRFNDAWIELLNDSQSKQDRAVVLAKCYANVIHMHPFEDGNGRVARTMAQLLLTHWGYDMLVIPKVRNDKQWKHALSKSLEGSYFELAGFFYKNMTQSN